jgi:hypothetical protein
VQQQTSTAPYLYEVVKIEARPQRTVTSQSLTFDQRPKKKKEVIASLDRTRARVKALRYKNKSNSKTLFLSPLITKQNTMAGFHRLLSFAT